MQNTKQTLKKRITGLIRKCTPVIIALMTVFSVATTNMLAAGGDLQKVSHMNHSFPTEYGWSYHFIPGVTTLTYGGATNDMSLAWHGKFKNHSAGCFDDPNFGVNNHIYFNLLNCTKGQPWARYNNVGQYKGRTVDLKYTIVDWTLHISDKQNKNGDYPTISFGTDKIQVTSSSYTSRNVRYRAELLYSGTNTRLPSDMKYHISAIDMDGAGSQTYKENNLDGTRRSAKESMNIQKSAYDGAYIADTNNMIINRDNGNGFMMFKNDSESQTTDDDINGWITFLMRGSSFEYSYNIDRWGDAYSTRGFYNHIFDGQSVAKFDSPVIYKEVSKSSIYTDDSGFNYTLSWSTPVEASSFKYGQIRIEDTLDSYLQKNGNIVVQNDAGTDITSMFNVDFNSGTNRLTMSAKQPSNSIFYGGSYRITIPVKIKSGLGGLSRGTMSNSAKLTTRDTTTSNTVSTNILFRISTNAEHGSITSSQNGISYNSNKTINYSPDSGYILKSLTIDGQNVDIKKYPSSYTFSNINKDHSIKAVFMPTFTVTTKGTRATITETQKSIPQGQSRTITWKPNERHAVTSVIIDGKKNNSFDISGDSYTFSNITANHSIEVVASPFSDLYFFGIKTEGVNSVISPSQAGVPYGATRNVTWKPDEGYQIESVTVDGKQLTQDDALKGTYTFSDIQDNHTVKVVSVKKLYKITTKSTHAKIDASISDIPHGENRTINFLADSGCYLTSIKVDNNAVAITDKNEGCYTFNDIQSNHLIEVSASPYYKITTYAENAMIDNDILNIEGGSEKSVNWKANEGYFIQSVLIDGKSEAITNKIQGAKAFLNISANHDIKVIAKPYHRITTYGEHVSIDKTIDKIEDGDSRTISWKCDTGYILSKLTVDGKEVTVENKESGKYEFNSITSDHDIKAVAVIKRFDITTSAKNTQITESQLSIPYGESRDILWKANEGYHIKSILVDNASEAVKSYTNDKKSFTNITSNHSVHVVAEPNYKITTKGTHVTITENQTNIYPKESRTIQFKAQEGYWIKSINVDGKAIGIDDISKGAYVFKDINEDHTIEVVAKIYTYDILTSGIHTKITPSMNGVEWGTDKTVSWNAEDGYHIVKQTVDGESMPVTNYRKNYIDFTHIQENHTVNVVSEPNYHIDTKATNATITKNQTDIYPEENRTITWDAGDGFWIQTVKIDGKEIKVDNIEEGSYTFLNIHENHSVEVVAVPKYVINTHALHASIDSTIQNISPHETKEVHYKADDGYWLSTVIIDGNRAKDGDYKEDSTTFTDIVADHKISVIAQPCFNIETEIVNGTITEKQTNIYPHENRTISFLPNEGYFVSEVIVDGHAYSYKEYPSEYIFNQITCDHRIKVVCEPLKTVTTQITNGIITKTMTGIHPDTDSKVIWESFDDYYVDSIVVDGNSVKTTDFKSGKFEFKPTKTDHTVVVVCRPKPIIHTTIDYGTITKTFNVYPHEDANVEAVPEKNRYIIDEKIDGQSENIKDETKFSKIFKDVTEDHYVDITTTKYPELDIKKTSDKTAYNMKDTVHYTIEVSETVAGTYIENVKLRDMISEDLAINKDSIKITGTDESNYDVEYVEDTDTVFVTLRKISSDEPVMINYDAQVKYKKDLAGKTIPNKVFVYGDRADSKEAETDIEVLKPNFEVLKESDKEFYNGNEDILYTVTLKQTSKEVKAYDVHMDDEIPEGLELNKKSISLSGLNEKSYSIQTEGNNIHVVMDEVSNLDTVVLTYKAKVGIELAGKSVTNKIGVSIPDTNDDLWNSEATCNILQPDFKISKEADKDVYKAGEYIFYEVDFKQIVKNGIANNVILKDELPEGVELDADSVSLTGISDDVQNAVEISKNKISCVIASVKDTDNPKLIYKAKVLDSSKGKSIKNVVQLTSDSTFRKVYKSDANVKVEKDVHTGTGSSILLFVASVIIVFSLFGMMIAKKRIR